MTAANHTSTQIRQALRSLGLSDNQIKIVSVLFHVKKASTKEISQLTAITYSFTQCALQSLLKLGLVTENGQSSKELYELCSRTEFFSWIDEQKAKHKELYDEAKKSIKSFLGDIDRSEWKPDVMYYEGKDGVCELYEDILKTASESDKKIYSWQDIKRVEDIFGGYVDDYIQERSTLGIESHSIVPHNETNLKHSKDKNEQRSTRFIKGLKVNGQVRVYGDKVAFITLHKENPIGFSFRGQVIADMFKHIFESSWEQLKPASSDSE